MLTLILLGVVVIQISTAFPILSSTNKTDSSGLNSSTTCPTWYIPSKYDPSVCACGDSLGRLLECHHDDQTIFARIMFCMSYDERTKQTLVGNCPYMNIEDYNSSSSTYFLQSQNESELNENLCGWANREGFMCSKCKKGLGVSVMTYDNKCVECIGSFKGWFLYLFLATVPTTLFYLLVIGFRIRSTTADMNGVTCLSQIVLFYINRYPNSILNMASGGWLFKTAMTISGVWSLDYFRYVIPPFCITEDLTTLNIIAMEYIVAIYPLVLIATTYVFIELHDRGCKPLLILWAPFKWCTDKITLDIDIRSSIVETFATFLLLTHSKLIFISYNLLGSTPLMNVEGQQVGSYVLFYDATVPYLSKTHLPYFILSIIVVLIFVLFPIVLLFLYPTKTFQNVLGFFSGVQWHPLHAFADAFNGCYKNGTNGSHDYRYFGAFYLTVRVVYHLTAMFSQLQTSILIILTPQIASLMISLLRPYKTDFYNVFDSILFFFLATLHLCIFYNMYVASLQVLVLPLGYIFSLIPIVHFFVVAVHSILASCAPNFLGNMKRKVKLIWGKRVSLCLKSDSTSTNQFMTRRYGYVDNRNGLNEGDDDDEESDRVRNPEQYRHLIKSHNIRGNEHIDNATATQLRNYGSV